MEPLNSSVTEIRNRDLGHVFTGGVIAPGGHDSASGPGRAASAARENLIASHARARQSGQAAADRPCPAALASRLRNAVPLRVAEQAQGQKEQRNGEWRYLEFLQVTSLITADIFMREIPGGNESRAAVPPS